MASQPGCIVQEYPPAPGNPRNSEGAFLEKKTGGFIFVYSRFSGQSPQDAAQADIALVDLDAQARCFSAPRILFTTRQYGAMNIMSVSLLRLKNGQMALFYLVRMSWDDMRVVMHTSADEGVTWSAPRYVTEKPAYYVLNNDRVIRLQSGRILFGAALHIIEHQGENVSKYGQSEMQFFYSDDDGLTWHSAENNITLSNPHSRTGLQEPGVVELGDNLVWAWARTDLDRQYEAFSRDGGCTWSAAAPSRFTSPTSPLSMKRLSDGRLLAVWNPIPTYETRSFLPGTGGRYPLVYATSRDNGLTWSPATALETDETRGYCYTAIYESTSFLLLAYCAGSAAEEGGCLTRLRIRRIEKAELL